MNNILTDYNSITDDELQKRVAFYEHIEFSNETIDLLIPDVTEYVHKIFHCLRLAKQNRSIVADICSQIVDSRTSSNTLVQSLRYHVGKITLDGRAFAHQNIHQYCHYIAEINDCFCQIINIAFDLGHRQWDHLDSEWVLDHSKMKKHPQIKKLHRKLLNIIRLHKQFDNFDKHNLILWGHEKITSASMKSVEYYFTMDGKTHQASKLIGEAQERKIKIAIIELLDNIFALCSTKTYRNRRYAHVLFEELLTSGNLPVYTDRYLAKQYIMPIVISTKTKKSRKIIASIAYTQQSSPVTKKLYLCRLDQEIIDGDILQIGLFKLEFNSFDVIKNGVCIGQYVCKNQKDQKAEYFHFKEYEFVPANSK